MLTVAVRVPEGMRPSSNAPAGGAALVAVAAVLLVACGGIDAREASTPVPTTAAPPESAVTIPPAVITSPAPTASSGQASTTEALPATSAPSNATPSSGARPESVVPVALIGATTVDGDPYDASVLAGRPTVAWFWAPWCVICRGEAPDVAAVAARYAEQVNFVGVAGLGATDEMREFVTDTGVGAFTHLDDSDGSIWASYEIYAQPAYAFITDDGRLETYPGALGAEGLAEIIELLLDA
jgi:thiol-disulfide isomerase/thioredoxin